MGQRGVLARRTVYEVINRDWFNTGILFLFNGILLFTSGVVNVCFCVDYHYYSRFWIGLIVSKMDFYLVHWIIVLLYINKWYWLH